ncbi:hypothetical protein QJQ45_027052 [Haematococcus lacustris]|nr:hypothetical protein QJQ45_027052 [Haematococcus lacustris]
MLSTCEVRCVRSLPCCVVWSSMGFDQRPLIYGGSAPSDVSTSPAVPSSPATSAVANSSTPLQSQGAWWLWMIRQGSSSAERMVMAAQVLRLRLRKKARLVQYRDSTSTRCEEPFDYKPPGAATPPAPGPAAASATAPSSASTSTLTPAPSAAAAHPTQPQPAPVGSAQPYPHTTYPAQPYPAQPYPNGPHAYPYPQPYSYPAHPQYPPQVRQTAWACLLQVWAPPPPAPLVQRTVHEGLFTTTTVTRVTYPAPQQPYPYPYPYPYPPPH